MVQALHGVLGHRDARPWLRPKFAAQYQAWRTAIVGMLQAQADALAIPSDASADEAASTLIALFEGYVLQKPIDPERFPEDFFATVLLRFFGHLTEPNPHQPTSQPFPSPNQRGTAAGSSR